MNGSSRVVVTGLGPVTTIGVGARDFHQAQIKGVSGIGPITRFDAAGLSSRIAGEVELPDALTPNRREALAADRCTHLARAAATLALADSGLDLAAEVPSRCGVAVGTGAGGLDTWLANTRTLIESGPGRLGARFIPMAMGNAPAARIAVDLGLTGPCTSVVTACASGAEALVAAYQMIVCGEADVVVAGGTEAAVNPLTVAGFARMGALSRRNEAPALASRPFAADRDGFVLAEGAAVLVLESAGHAARRGATVLAELRGYGRSCDAHHITAPHPEGAGARQAITSALAAARLGPEDVSYVNAHGTGTQFNDASEALALHGALGRAAATVPVSATKSMTGHALGASGAIEAVASVQALVHQVVPPTVNLDDPDPAVGLDVVAADPRELPLTAVLSNSFAFGGHNVVLAFTTWA
ncbi:beta-ketoacyl-[acyl-carrier-protein] synthase family protein [Streptomyces sp. NBC_01198]|uniref:beta-ketoacyl-[acyl-carrier-protein] synthase family protein n=1 Tax=Streptomyces sp. NBC_01198 TaxID=2903769 RepID=UPI002E13768F|nr:beta-ketoacyl-[acyl-carrier-protein] synthase family protein [Streptomyces sp. NBC_01198]